MVLNNPLTGENAMTPSEAWEYAASWGSYMHSGDPGACMYGFDHNCRPQNEEHRHRVLAYMETCRASVVEKPDDYEEGELGRLDEFVEFITHRPLEGDDSPINREITFRDSNLCEVSYGAVLDAIQATESDPFTMTIRSQSEWSVIVACVNAGIDSHLEAITDSKFDNGDCEVAPHDLCILLRRLAELEWSEDDWDVATSLQSSILMTLGFNDSGKYVGREALGLA
jgi:hypothetical protein